MTQIIQRHWFFPALEGAERAEQPFPLQKEELLALQAALETGRHLPRSLKALTASTFELSLEELENPEVYAEYVVYLLPYGGPFSQAFSYIVRDSSAFLERVFPAYLQLAHDVVGYSLLIEQRYQEMDQLAQRILQAPDAAQRRPPLEQLRLLLQEMHDEVQPFVFHADEVEQQTALLTHNFEESQQRLEERKREYSSFIQPSSSLLPLVEEGKALQTQVESFNAGYQRDVTQALLQAQYLWVEPLGVLATPDNTSRASEGQLYMQEMMRLMQAYYNAAKIQAAKAIIHLASHKTELLLASLLVDVTVAVPIVQKMRGLWTSVQHDMLALMEQLEESLDEENWRLIDAEVREAIARWKNLAQQAQRYLDVATIQVAGN